MSKEIDELYDYFDRRINGINPFENYPLTSDKFNVSGSGKSFKGTIEKGSNRLVVEDDHDFQVGQGLTIIGAGELSKITDPINAPFVIESNFRAGTDVIRYSVVGFDGNGAITKMGPTLEITATLPFYVNESVKLGIVTRSTDVYYLMWKETSTGESGWITAASRWSPVFYDIVAARKTEILETTMMPLRSDRLTANVVSVVGHTVYLDKVASTSVFKYPIYHDNTIQIQKFLNSIAGNRRGQLGLSDGDVMMISNVLTTSSNTNLTIKGTIKYLPFLYDSDAAGILWLQGNNVIIRGGILDGVRDNMKKYNPFSGICSVPPGFGTVLTNCLIEGLTVKNVQNWNLNITGTNVLIKNCQFLQCGSSNQIYTKSYNCWVVDCYFQEATWDGVFAFYGSCIRCGLIRCFIDSINSYGIGMFLISDGQHGDLNPVTGKFITSSDILIEGNVIINAVNIGIANMVDTTIDEKCRNIVVRNNILHNVGQGIKMSDVNNAVIENNYIRDCYYGIWTTDNYITVNNNVINNSVWFGVGFSGEYVVIKNNKIFNDNGNVSKSGIFNWISGSTTSSINNIIIKDNVISEATFPLNLMNVIGTVNYPTNCVVKENVGTICYRDSSPWVMTTPAMPSSTSTVLNPYSIDAMIIINNNVSNPITSLTIRGATMAISKMITLILKGSEALTISGSNVNATWLWIKSN